MLSTREVTVFTPADSDVNYPSTNGRPPNINISRPMLRVKKLKKSIREVSGEEIQVITAFRPFLENNVLLV